MQARRARRWSIFEAWFYEQDIPAGFNREMLRLSIGSNCSDVPVNEIIGVAKATFLYYTDNNVAGARDAGIIE